jgi:hypothetical protein
MMGRLFVLFRLLADRLSPSHFPLFTAPPRRPSIKQQQSKRQGIQSCSTAANIDVCSLEQKKKQH